MLIGGARIGREVEEASSNVVTIVGSCGLDMMLL